MAPKDSIERFNGKKIHMWETKLRFHLMKKGLWDIELGTKDTRSQTRESTSQIELKTHKSMGIIKESFHDTYIHHIGNCKTTQEARTILEKTFGATSKVSKIILFIQFFGLQKDYSQTMSEHLNEFKSLLSQLSSIKEEIEDDMKIAVLIKSISTIDEYSSLVTTLTNLPSPTLEEVEASLLEEEKRINKKTVSVTENALYNKVKSFTDKGNSKTYPSQRSNFKAQIKCTFCGKANHIENECYKKQRIKALLVHDKDPDGGTLEEQSTTFKEQAVVVEEDSTSINKEWAF